MCVLCTRTGCVCVVMNVVVKMVDAPATRPNTANETERNKKKINARQLVRRTYNEIKIGRTQNQFRRIRNAIKRPWCSARCSFRCRFIFLTLQN